MTVAETTLTDTGTLALRGPMVPRQPFPPDAEHMAAPYLNPDTMGFVDTLYPSRIDPETETMTITGPPPGMVVTSA